MHCHYPMHLLEDDEHPHGVMAGWLRDLADHVRAEGLGIAAHLINDPRLSDGWRVDLDGLIVGQVGLLCSVLYWPAGEFRLGTRPAGNAFQDLQGLFDRVEADLRQRDPANQRHIVVGPEVGPSTTVGLISFTALRADSTSVPIGTPLPATSSGWPIAEFSTSRSLICFSKESRPTHPPSPSSPTGSTIGSSMNRGAWG